MAHGGLILSPAVSLFYTMISTAQIKADFNKLRDPAHEHGQIVTLKFQNQECRAIRSTSSQTVRITDYGEIAGEMFTVRFLVDDLAPLPKEKDIVLLDGVDYQVAEVRTSGLGQIYRVYIMDEDA